MPQTLTESIAYANTITGPADADGMTAASVNSPLTQLANRTAYLRNQIDSGVKRFSTILSLVGLKSLTGMADGDIRLVQDYGFFRYNSAATDASAEPMVVVPAVGGGRWLAVDYLARNAANGVAGLDANGRVRTDNLPSFVYSAAPVASAVSATGDNATTVTATPVYLVRSQSFATPYGANAVFASVTISVKRGTAGNLTLSLALEDPFPTVVASTGSIYIDSTSYVPVTLTGLFRGFAASSTKTIAVYCSADANGLAYVRDPAGATFQVSTLVSVT